MDAELLAYLAGVLDSDGSISIVRHKPNAKYPDSFTFSEVVQVAQTATEAVALFAETWPGTHVTRKRHQNWKPMFEWRVNNQKASACVATLRPYLRVKARQADFVLALRASKNRPRNEVRTESVGGRGVRLDPGVVAERTAMWLGCRALNDNRLRVNELGQAVRNHDGTLTSWS